MNEFAYSLHERREIAGNVPDAGYLEGMSDWGRMVHFPYHREFEADKEGYVARELERSARECLGEVKRSLHDDCIMVSKISETAARLRSFLNQPNAYRPNYAIAFLGAGHGWREGADDAALQEHEILDRLLSQIESDAPEVEESFRVYHGHDAYVGKHSPGFSRFVSQALSFWQMWTGKAPGGGKQGGPAARFLVAAANPLIRHAEKQDIIFRRGGELTKESAGELIARHRAERASDE